MATIVLNQAEAAVLVPQPTNVGVGGIGIVASPSVQGSILRFKSINSTTASITVDDDAVNNKVDLTLNAGSIDHTGLLNSGTITHTQIEARLPTTDEKAGLDAATTGPNPPTASNRFVTNDDVSSSSLQLVVVNGSDTTPGNLSTKLVSTGSFDLTAIGPAANPSLRVSATFGAALPAASDAGLASVGTVAELVRADHKHSISTAAPSTGIGADNSIGLLPTLARSDHDHKLKESGGDELTLGAIPTGQFLTRSGTAIIGAAVVVTDKRVAFDASDATPSHLSNKLTHGAGLTQSTITGPNGNQMQVVVDTSTIALVADARFPTADEKAALASAITPNASNKYITASELALTGNLITVTATDTTPGTLDDKLVAGDGIDLTVLAPTGNAQIRVESEFATAAPVNSSAAAASIGSLNRAAREDHKHSIDTAAPATGIGADNSIGLATTLARSDHDHKLKESGSGDELTIGAIAAGQFLTRSGTAIIGAAVSDTDENIKLTLADTVASTLNNKLAFDATAFNDNTGAGTFGLLRTISLNFTAGAGHAAESTDARFPTANEKAAMTAASTPNASNAFATIVDIPSGSGATTGLNVGTGTGEVFKSKAGFNLEMRRVASLTSAITVATVTNEINLNLVPGSIDHQALLNGNGANTHTQIDTHIDNGTIHAPLSGTNPLQLNATAAASSGSAADGSRQDHVHSILTAAPTMGIGGGNSVGSASSLARSDHGHALKESGGTDLTIGAVTNMQILQRSGTTLIGIPLVDNAVGLTSGDTQPSTLDKKLAFEATAFNESTAAGPSGDLLTISLDLAGGAGKAAAWSDARFPTTDQKAALASAVTPNATNLYVTASELSASLAVTGSNVGVGADFFKQKTGNLLEIRSIRALSSRITAAVSPSTNEVDLDVAPDQIDHQGLSGAGTNDHVAIDAHIANAAIHGVPSSNPPTTITPDASANAGTGVQASADDHVHSVVTESPTGGITANAEGTANSFARSDHDHSFSPDALTVNSITDGYYLRRSGANIIGAATAGASVYGGVYKSKYVFETGISSATYFQYNSVSLDVSDPAGTYLYRHRGFVFTAENGIRVRIQLLNDSVVPTNQNFEPDYRGFQLTPGVRGVGQTYDIQFEFVHPGSLAVLCSSEARISEGTGSPAATLRNNVIEIIRVA